MISLDPIIKTEEVKTFLRKKEVSNTSIYSRYGKRFFDILFSLSVTIFLLSWLLPLAGLIIKLNSTGPVFFVQLRTGINGRKFKCLKLRTMYHSENAKFKQATAHDPRITHIGSILRRTGIDELPQFINVLLGDMSVVGPRPHAVQHDREFWDVIPNYPIRYTIKPGITGLAQVRGARGETEAIQKMEHRVRYDLYYIKKQSFALDLKLCLNTVSSMINGRVNAW